MASDLGSSDQRGTDAGAILIFVLIFMLGIALTVSAIVSAATTAEVGTQGQTTAHADDYAVDGGIEYGIEQIRANDPTWCPSVASPAPRAINIDSASVSVSCTATLGTLQSISNWAVITLDPGAGSLTTQSGGGVTKQILGPTYVTGGVDLKTPLEDDTNCSNSTPPCSGPDGTGIFDQFQTSCPGSVSQPGNLTAKWACTATPSSALNVNVSLPSSIPALAPAAWAKNASCTVVYPGTYNAANPFPVTAGNSNQGYYLASGIYYLDNVGTVDLGTGSKADRVFGGQPSAIESQVLPSSDGPCSTDLEANQHLGIDAATGSGIEVILGGNSQLAAGDGHLEFFAREPAGGVTTEGTSGISLRTVTTSAGGWDTSTLGNTTDAFSTDSGNNPSAAIHGFIYLPNASAFLFGTNTDIAEILGGVLAWDVALQASSSAADFVIQTSQNPTVTSENIMSSVQYAGKTITAKAVVEITNGNPRTVAVDSWSVNNP